MTTNSPRFDMPFSPFSFGSFTEFIPSIVDTMGILNIYDKKEKWITRKTSRKKNTIGTSKDEVMNNEIVIFESNKVDLVSTTSIRVAIL